LIDFCYFFYFIFDVARGDVDKHLIDFEQLCGARGGGDAAVRSLYWVAHKNLTFMLVLDTERERNAAILLARRFAFDCNVRYPTPLTAISLCMSSCSLLHHNFLRQNYDVNVISQ
jgi:hypothetical protein